MEVVSRTRGVVDVRVVFLALCFVHCCGFLTRSDGSPEVIANVSLLLANYYTVDCVQFFRTNKISFERNEFIQVAWKNLAVPESTVTTGIYTYHGYIERKKLHPRKVSCYRSLKIMSDDEESRRGYSELTQLFSFKDAVWLLYSNSLSLNFFKTARVLFDDVIIIAVVKTNSLVLFYEIYRISPNFPLKVLTLGNWTERNGLLLSDENFYDRRSDLEGLELRTAALESWPATYLKNGKWSGFLIKVWNEITSMINCTSVSIRAPDNFVGMRMDNGSWNGLVGMASRDEIDVLISEIVIDKERSRIVKFFYPIMKTRFQIYTRHLGYEWQWSSVLKPFDLTVWLAALAWIIVGTVCIAFSYQLCLNCGLESNDFEKMFTPVKSLLFVVQAFCQKGYHVTPKSYTCRILFFLSYAVSSVLIPSYSASLVSSLSQKTYYKSFNSLQELVADGKYRLLVKENSAQHAFFAHTKDKFIKQAYEKLAKSLPEEQRKMGLRSAMKAICHLQNYAVMGIEEIVDVRLTRKRKPDCTIVPLRIPVSTIHLTMATPKNSPFWGIINHHLEKLLVNGIVSRLKTLEFPPSEPPQRKSETEVGIKQVASVFALFAVFTIISVFILFIEIQHYAQTTKREKLRRKRRNIHQDKAKILLAYEMKMYQKLRSLT